MQHSPHRFPVTILTTFLVSLLLGAAETDSLKGLKLSQLEEKLEKIDLELKELAQTSLRTGIGAIGHRSNRHDSEDYLEWVEINLGEECTLDEIILVPNVYRDTRKGFLADGFPAEFRIITGTSIHDKGTVLGEYSSLKDKTISVAPYVINAGGAKASWVRIEATRLTQRAFNKNSNKHYIFQLAEVFLFSGEKNVALHQPVKASSEHPELRNSAWNKRFLVDGHTPYIMNAAQGRQSVAFLSQQDKFPVLRLDLEKEVSLSRIHLHAIDQSDTVPQAYAGNFGIPPHFLIEGASKPDFSDSQVLLDIQPAGKNEIGTIMMWNIPETICRYVRLVSVDPVASSQIGFAEIELFSDHENIALGKEVSNVSGVLTNRSLRALTDGLNLYGEILPIRGWLNQLARRELLETLRPRVVKELSQRYEKQKVTLQRISWFTALLIIGAIFLIWFGRIVRQRAVMKTRERIAANLHDELGANLHAIGLLGDYAKKIVARKSETGEWTELNGVIDEVRLLTEETGETARYCTNMLESKEIHVRLIEEMERTTKRMLADLKHDTIFPAEDTLYQLKPRRRIDLYLFYKECLTNIIRHSGATHVSTELSACNGEVSLKVSDNGHGYMESEAPASLRRRAKMLGGSVQVECLQPTGTQITLTFSTLKRNRFKRPS